MASLKTTFALSILTLLLANCGSTDIQASSSDPARDEPVTSLRVPLFSNLAKGDICMAEITLRIAGQTGHSDCDIDFLHTYSTPGKMLKMWIDGTLVADYTPNRDKVEGTMADASRWASSATADGLSSLSKYSVERIRVKASEIADGKWHEVKLLMGVVTPATIIEIGPHHAKDDPTVKCAFFIDNIVAKRIPYDVPSDIYEPSLIIDPKSSTALSRLKSIGASLGITKYIDIAIGTSFFYEKNPDGTFKKDASGKWILREGKAIESEIQAMADNIHGIGYKIWNIHMPATTPEGSYNGEIFEYYHWDTPTRLAAVELTKKIMKWLKPFESHCLMAHATGPGRSSSDPRIQWPAARDNGVASFRSLVEYANSDDMRYGDGTHPIFCIENIQNTGTSSLNVNASPDYMNYCCQKVPGLKICYDTAHGQVGSGISADEYLRRLGTNLCAVHIHGNGMTTVDKHIYPGYSNGIYTAGGNDIMDWGKIYKALVDDCHYNGPFTYEISSNAEDHIASFNNVVHNYYNVVLPAYKKLK